MCPALVALDDQIRMQPKERPAKEFSALKQRAKKRITIVEPKVVQEKPSMKEVEYDWAALLDVATKKSGIVRMIESSYTNIL